MQDLTGAAALDEQLPHSNGNGGPSIPEWSPPRTRDEADTAIIALSNDIGLILAQLAEDQVAWCARTGRAPSDYAAWRRRALFAKVHKEGQLRECKRVRAQLASVAGAEGDGGFAGARAGSAELMAWCRLVVEAWLDEGAPAHGDRLGQALAHLAEYLDRVETSAGGNVHFELGGTRARPVAIGRQEREPAVRISPEAV